MLKLIEKGQVSELILELFRCNVRAPEETIGDLMANASATSVGGRMLLEFMDEYGIDDISEIADVIISQSETAIRDELRKIPDGCYENAILVEGVEGTVRLACAVAYRRWARADRLFRLLRCGAFGDQRAGLLHPRHGLLRHQMPDHAGYSQTIWAR